MAFGAVSALLAVNLLGGGLLMALFVYSLAGAMMTMFVAWRRFRCVERGERLGQGQNALIAAQ